MLRSRGCHAQIRRCLYGTASAAVISIASSAQASGQDARTALDIPAEPLSSALKSVSVATDNQVLFSEDLVAGRMAPALKGQYSVAEALAILVKDTNLHIAQSHQHVFLVEENSKPVRVAANTAPAAPAQAGVETVVVTAQKKSENIQSVPISVTALSQQQLTERQIAGGPDLLRDVPNMNFTKTNFSGYDIELRGIGTQAISVTTDPAVAVAFNDIPFIRNHFFEQEFYDLQDAEVLRGPQGTLYGRNATAGVVNLKSTLPTDQYEAMLSADLGNYENRRLEGMLNLPISGDQLDIRIAGEWTKRDGYTEDTTLNTSVDGRDLYSTRMTIGWKPASNLQTYFIWEHFSEDDDRLRSGKQLCKTDYGPGYTPNPNPTGPYPIYGYVNIDGVEKPVGPQQNGDFFSQGCSADVSLYSPQAFEEPLGVSLPYIFAGQYNNYLAEENPFLSETQSTNLRDIESQIKPIYRAKNDTLEYNVAYAISPSLTFISQTGYNNDFLYSFEDYNRFGSVPNIFINPVCDPQLGCSSQIILDDLSTEHAWQASQEFRLASNFSGPFNFNVGGNYLHYETVEDYYVFSNVFTRLLGGFAPGSTNSNEAGGFALPYNYQYNDPGHSVIVASNGYIDPNPLSSLNNEGHNYFLSENPYVLNSYAAFGEMNYDILSDLKFTGGLRWTDDQKHFLDIPSWLVESGYGYPVYGVVDQQWQRLTGRSVLNWTPQLDFTDQSMFYASYAHGYKAGGANPPGALFSSAIGTTAGEVDVEPTHPLTFKPEYIEAFELGTKNTLLDNTLTLDADIFYYNYTGYQISEIVDRTAINNNYNSHVEGAELESNWEPLPGLKFGFTGGFEDTALASGTQGVDLLDRTAGTPGWYVVRPFVNEASNCIFPGYVAQHIGAGTPVIGGYSISYCSYAYILHDDPLTGLPYVPNPTVTAYGFPLPSGYPGFNPATAPNDGTGFSKNLGGNALPNAPHFTTSLSAGYSMPVSEDWVATLHSDFYWQSQSWARVFEDPIDKLHGYSNVNVALDLTSANGWDVMAYVKNVFNVTAITGTFLNSDDSGLTTNVFLTDPRLIGIRVTKHLDQDDGFWGKDYNGYDFFTGLFSDTDSGKPPLWVELGGQFEQVTGLGAPFTAPFLGANPTSAVLWSDGATPLTAQRPSEFNTGEEAKVTYQPDDSDWIVTAAIKYGRAHTFRHVHNQPPPNYYSGVHKYQPFHHLVQSAVDFADTQSSVGESDTIVDFQAGKDVGLGILGSDSESDINLGVRMAQFSAYNATMIHARPEVFNHPRLGFPFFVFHSYAFEGQASRSFHGIGPSISWNSSDPVLAIGDHKLDVDWGANFAVLFGRNRMAESHQTTGYYRQLGDLLSQVPVQYRNPLAGSARNHVVAVPDIGGFAGLSYRYNNAKISFGYRADVFFGAMDGGIAVSKSETVNMSGPFATISFGFGG